MQVVEGLSGRQRCVDGQLARFLSTDEYRLNVSDGGAERRLAGRGGGGGLALAAEDLEPVAVGGVEWVTHTDLAIAAKEPREGVVAAVHAAGQQQVAALAITEDGGRLKVYSVAARNAAAPRAQVRAPEQLERQPDRVAANIVQRAACEIAEQPDVVWPGDLEVEVGMDLTEFANDATPP